MANPKTFHPAEYNYSRALTLRQLHARLGEIIAEHDATQRSERNDQPVVIRVGQAKTESGRRRDPMVAPVGYAFSHSLILSDDDGRAFGTIELATC